MINSPPSMPEVDVAIVGGGVSGIYTGYRLLTADLRPSTLLSTWEQARGGRLAVRVIEGSDRIGGRLMSATPPGMPRTVVELGGMRYISSQKLVKSLIQNELCLPRHEQVVDQPNNLAYLRGAHLRGRDLTAPAKLPYNLTAAEREHLAAGNSPNSLIGWALEQMLPKLRTLPPEGIEGYLKEAEIDGTPLYKQGFWNVIARGLSVEAFQLCRATIGYDSLGANANAVDMTVEYFKFTPDAKYYLLDQGFETVPCELATRFKEKGGEVVPNKWLTGFVETRLTDGTMGVRLKFSEGEPLSARAIVLAMPRRAIELLRPEGRLLDPKRSKGFREMLRSVSPVALYKMFVAYPYPWWEACNVKQGRSLTDIPLRQCYYWAVEGRQKGAVPENTNAAVMLYNDVSNVEFWGGLSRVKQTVDDPSAGDGTPVPISIEEGSFGEAFEGEPMPYESGADSNPDAAMIVAAGEEPRFDLRANWDNHKAPKSMVMEVHRQLLELHAVRYAPQPHKAAYMDWSRDPYGGGVHFWNAGYKSWEVVKRMTQPDESFPCFVCGEAFSTNQTWVEGALETAEIVLQDRLGLKPPPWSRE